MKYSYSKNFKSSSTKKSHTLTINSCEITMVGNRRLIVTAEQVEMKNNVHHGKTYSKTVSSDTKRKVAKEADSDLFCPFASVCFFHTNTTLRLKRHIEALHQNDMSTYNCIFPSCSFEATNSLKSYSAHLRDTHPEDVKKTLTFIRCKKPKSSETCTLRSSEKDDMESPFSKIETNGIDSPQGAFLIVPSGKQSQFQPIVKTKSPQIIQGAKLNGFSAISSETPSENENENTIVWNKTIRFCTQPQDLKTGSMHHDVIIPGCTNESKKYPDLNQLKDFHLEGNANEKAHYLTNNISFYGAKSLSEIQLNHCKEPEKLYSISRADSLSRKQNMHKNVIRNVESIVERTMETERQLQELVPDPDLIPKIPKINENFMKVIQEDIEDDITSEGKDSFLKKEIDKGPNLATKMNHMLEAVLKHSNKHDKELTDYRSRKREYHMNNVNQQPTFILPLNQCSVCQKILPTQRGLKSHMRLHNHGSQCKLKARSPIQLAFRRKYKSRKHKLGLSTLLPPS